MRTLNDGGNDGSNNSKHGSSKNSHISKEIRAIDDSGNFEQDSSEDLHDKPDNKRRKKEKIILKLSTKYEKNNEGMWN